MQKLIAIVLAGIAIPVSGEPIGLLFQEKGELSGYGTLGGTPDRLVGDPIITLIEPPKAEESPAPEVPELPPLNRTRIESLPAFGADPEPAVSPKKRQAPFWIEPPLPANLLRPDASGSILIARTPGGAVDASQQNPRNPWGIRVTTKASVTEYVVRLDGIMVGPSPTALLNGLPIQRGERQVGPFTLAVIRSKEVVMEFDGIYFLVPEGKSILVRIPKN